MFIALKWLLLSVSALGGNLDFLEYEQNIQKMNLGVVRLEE